MVFVLTLDVTLRKLRTTLQTSRVGFLGVRFAIPCLKLIRTNAINLKFGTQVHNLFHKIYLFMPRSP